MTRAVFTGAGRPPTRLLGAAVLATAATLCAAAIYFVAVRPQACRPLTVPLVAVLLGLGVFRWRWQLLLAVFLTPLLYWLPGMDDAVRLRLAKLMVSFVLLFWGLRLMSPAARPLPPARIVPPLLLYSGLVLLSAVLTLWRYEPLLSWETARIVGRNLIEINRATWLNWLGPEFGIVRETVVYLTGPLVLLLLVHAADAALVSRLRAVLLSSLGIAACVALYQKVSGAASLALSVQGREGLQRIYGTLGDANTFGAYLALLLPLLSVEAFLAWRPRSEGPDPGPRLAAWVWRWTALASVALVLLALVWTASRAAWIGVAVGALAATGLAARARSRGGAARRGVSPQPRWTSAGRYAAVGALCVAAAWFLYSRTTAVPFQEWRSPADAFRALFSPEHARRELGARWMWWAPALRMGTELPLTGVGVGQYRFFNGPYWSGPEMFGIVGDPHNSYLKPFAELGLPGLALFLWICWAVWRAWRAPPRLRLGSRTDLRRLAAGVGLLALLVDMLFQHVLVQTEMQVIAAAVVALAILDDRGRVRG